MCVMEADDNNVFCASKRSLSINNDQSKETESTRAQQCSSRGGDVLRKRAVDENHEQSGGQPVRFQVTDGGSSSVGSSVGTSLDTSPGLKVCPMSSTKSDPRSQKENPWDASNIFLPKDIKKSFSFGGYGLLPGLKNREEITFSELKLLVEEGKKEPTKTTKQKIKEFAHKYKDFKPVSSGRLPWYREVLQQSQLAHLITIVAVVSLAFRLCPDSRRSPAESSTLTRLVYIATVSAVFGAEFWMTFVSGLALFFSVPRHVFAQVQVVLFPLYFLLKAVLLLLALFAYTQHRPTHTWNTSQFVQGTLLAVGFLVNLAIRLYLSPPLISLITIKMAIEREEGLGSEVGTSAPGRLQHCPHYMKMHRAFRKIHALIAVGNIISMATTSLHLYNLAIELCSVV